MNEITEATTDAQVADAVTEENTTPAVEQTETVVEATEEKHDDLARSLTKGSVWRAAESKPVLVDEGSRRAEIVWTTGATVKRAGLFGDWNETLRITNESVRMQRLNSGAAPLLKNHDASDISSVIGVVERAWLGQNEGRAIVRFSDRPEVDGIFADVKNGILRSISVGYRVHGFEETTAEADQVRSFLATDWEPLELSVVPIPADAAAGFRAEMLGTEQQRDPVEERMNETKTPEINIEDVKKEAINAERARAVAISDAVRKAGLEEAFAHKMIEEGVSVDQARATVIEKLAEKTKATQTTNHVRIEVGTEERDNLVEGAKSALLHRYNPGKYQLADNGRRFVGRNLVETARIFVESKGIKTEGMSAGQIAERALHSTSDFPLLLGNVANAVLKAEYAEEPSSYGPIVREAELPDYKEKKVLEAFGKLKMEPLLEGGEYRRGSLGESSDGYSLADYGKMIGITRKTIVNDDLGVFSRVPGLFGRACRDLEQELVWSILGENQALADGKTLFHAGHGNLGTASEISVEAMSEARKMMRTQSDAAGNLVRVRPQFLIVPAALETKAQQFLATNVSPIVQGEVNPFAGSLQLIVEPLLDQYSETAWYLAASPSTIDGIEVGYLSGERGPQMATREGFEIEGVEIKCRLTVAAKCWNHRGFFKNPGA